MLISRHLRRLVPAILLTLAPFLTSPGRAETTGWETMSNPETHQGLVISPRLLQIRGRVSMFWGGTSKEARNPEIFFSSRGDGDSQWSVSRAPFFGADVGRVRHLAVATARDMMAMIFQREGGQGGGAMEIMMSISSDMGYAFSAPFLLDSYVLGDTNGSWVTLAARQGRQRSEFAVAWVAEGGTLRATSIDSRSDSRAQAETVGHLSDLRGRAEMLSAGSEGFFLVWPEAMSGLKTARIKALVGGTEKALSLAPGDYSKNFCLAYLYRGPGAVVATNESGDTQSFITEDERLKPLNEKQKDVLTGRGLESRACMDGKKRIHRVTLNPAGNKLYYTMQDGGKWTAPELIVDLAPDVTATGIDITVTEDYVWVVASQGQLLQIKRKKLG